MVLVAKLVVACGFNNFLVDSEFLMVVNLLKLMGVHVPIIVTTNW